MWKYVFSWFQHQISLTRDKSELCDNQDEMPNDPEAHDILKVRLLTSTLRFIAFVYFIWLILDWEVWCVDGIWVYAYTRPEQQLTVNIKLGLLSVSTLVYWPMEAC